MNLWTRRAPDEGDRRGLLSVFIPKAFRFDRDFDSAGTGLQDDRAVREGRPAAAGLAGSAVVARTPSEADGDDAIPSN